MIRPVTIVALLTLLLIGCAERPNGFDEALGTETKAGVVRALTAYPEGPLLERFAVHNGRENLGEGVPDSYITRVTGPTRSDGTFRVTTLIDHSGRRLRDILLHRAEDGSVSLVRVLSAKNESRGGAPFRYFAYEPPMVLVPSELGGPEPSVMESALVELRQTAPYKAGGRGTVRRRVRVMSDEEMLSVFGELVLTQAGAGCVGYAEELEISFSVARRTELGYRLLAADGGMVASKGERLMKVLGVQAESSGELELLVGGADSVELEEDPRMAAGLVPNTDEAFGSEIQILRDRAR